MATEFERVQSEYERCCQVCQVHPRKTVLEQIELALDGAEDESKAQSGALQVDLILRGDCIELFKTRMRNDDVQALAAAVKSAGLVVGKLDLSFNELDDVGAEAVLDIVLNAQVASLDLTSNAIGPVGLQMLLDACASGQCSLTELVLNANPLGKTGGMALARVLATDSMLTRVEIESTEQDTDSLVALATALRENSTLQNINLGNPRVFSFDDETTTHIASMLEVNKTIETLGLAKHRIRCTGASILAKALELNTSVRSLNLRCNQISIAGARAIARLLVSDSNGLVELDLEANRVADEGAAALGAALEFTKSLQSLNLRSNSICDEGLCALGRGLAVNVSLCQIYLWGNHFGREASEIFFDLSTGRFLHYDVKLDFEPHIPPDGEAGSSRSGSGGKQIHIARLE